MGRVWRSVFTERIQQQRPVTRSVFLPEAIFGGSTVFGRGRF